MPPHWAAAPYATSRSVSEGPAQTCAPTRRTASVRAPRHRPPTPGRDGATPKPTDPTAPLPRRRHPQHRRSPDAAC